MPPAWTAEGSGPGPLSGIWLRDFGNDELVAAVKEAIAVGERAGVPVDIIHLKIADQKLWGHMSEVVALIEEARKRGVNVQANVYPYTRGNNNLASIIPPWAHEGGTAQMLARLKEPKQRERLKRRSTRESRAGTTITRPSGAIGAGC